MTTSSNTPRVVEVAYCPACGSEDLTTTNTACYACGWKARCAEHPAYEADYCPVCGTAQVIGR
jgi:Zn-finger nucleic acid-binding protein